MSRHQIEITADEQHYILNGICYHITFPIHLALEHPTQKQRVCPNAPERPKRPLNLKYSEHEDETEDYFERFLAQMEASDTNTPYDAILEFSDQEEELGSLNYYVSEDEEEEQEEEDKENQPVDDMFSKMDQAVRDGHITFREKMFNTQYLCCNN